MDTSLFVFPTDLMDEGIDAVLGNVAGRAGAGGITLACVYHAARDIFPHNPRRRLRFLEAGVCSFRPDAQRYPGLALQPRPSRLLEETDVLADAVAAAGRRGLAVHAWAVYLHSDWVHDPRTAQAERTCFGDPKLTELCPANPDVRAYVQALTRDIAHRGVDTILAESLHYHPLEHGYHHERYFLPLGARTRFLLGLCFCDHCLSAARRLGVDAEGVARYARDEVQRIFDGGEDPSAELDEGEARALAGGELGGYLDARASIVSTLVGEIAQATAAEGARLTFLDASGAVKGYADGRPTGGPAADIAWKLGVDLAAVVRAGASVEAIAYAADPARVATDLGAYRASLPPGGGLAAALRAMVPDCASTENLVEKVRMAREAGVERVDFYHYGFMPLSALDRVREAVGRST